ncbi:unnamed protein product, partial [Closterium sp. Naga37s-1]
MATREAGFGGGGGEEAVAGAAVDGGEVPVGVTVGRGGSGDEGRRVVGAGAAGAEEGDGAVVDGAIPRVLTVE